MAHRFSVALLALAMAPVAVPGAAPVTSGVYLSADDYAAGTLTASGGCDAPLKIALHDVLNKPFVDVSRGSEKKQFAKNELFGVRLCDGQDYRLSSNRLYRILARGDLFIYGVEHPISQGKGFRVVPSYYFSPGPRAEIRPLTLEHLQEAFAANHRFVDSLDRLSDQDLAQYDGYHQQYRVVRLLAESTSDR
jgi:hypothetical protein